MPDLPIDFDSLLDNNRATKKRRTDQNDDVLEQTVEAPSYNSARMTALPTSEEIKAMNQRAIEVATQNDDRAMDDLFEFEERLSRLMITDAQEKKHEELENEDFLSAIIKEGAGRNFNDILSSAPKRTKDEDVEMTGTNDTSHANQLTQSRKRNTSERRGPN